MAVLALCCALATAGAAAAARSPRADLRVAAATTSATTAAAGSTLGVSATVRNAGAGTAPASTARVQLSTDTQPGGDVTLADVAVKKLRKHTQAAVGATVVVPATTPAGVYHVLVCADATRKVRESHENDDCGASGPVTVTRGATPPTPPDPTCGSCTIHLSFDRTDAGTGPKGTSSHELTGTVDLTLAADPDHAGH